MAVDDYKALAKALDNAGPLLRRYAKQTEINMEGIERKWLRLVVLSLSSRLRSLTWLQLLRSRLQRQGSLPGDC